FAARQISRSQIIGKLTIRLRSSRFLLRAHLIASGRPLAILDARATMSFSIRTNQKRSRCGWCLCFVVVECGACGHDEMIQTIALTQGLRLGPDERITDLAHRMRCRQCDEKGRAVVSIRWAQ